MALLLRGVAPIALCLLLAFPAQATDPQLEAYARRAVEVVADEMERMEDAPGQFRLEVVRGPVFLRECNPGQGPPSHEKAHLPRALVLVAVIGSAEHVERLYQVGFEGEGASTHASAYGMPHELLMPLDEWRRLTAEVSPFYETGLDINRGPERFYPYLPRDMHTYSGPESADLVWLLPREIAAQLSDDELRHLAASFLDFLAHLAWLDIQGEPVDSWVEGLELENEPDGAESVQRMLARVTQLTMAMKDRLRASRCFDPAYQAASSRYLRALLGEGLVAKAWNEDLIRGLPRWTELYFVGWGFYIVLAKPRGKLEAVSVLVAD